MLAKLLVRLIAPICILLTQPLFAAATDDPLKIGLIVPLTGGQASTGKQLDNAVKLYISENGDMVAGRKIEVIVKDDGAVPDNTKRIAQEQRLNEGGSELKQTKRC
jgi:branched-chain amino acid transport system substrate-binding protein